MQYERLSASDPADETVKTVRIHDWRIGCLYWSLMACIAIYTVGYEILYAVRLGTWAHTWHLRVVARVFSGGLACLSHIPRVHQTGYRHGEYQPRCKPLASEPLCFAQTYNRGTPRYCQRSNEQPRTVLPDGVTKYPCTWMDDMEMVYNRGPVPSTWLQPPRCLSP